MRNADVDFHLEEEEVKVEGKVIYNHIYSTKEY